MRLFLSAIPALPVLVALLAAPLSAQGLPEPVDYPDMLDNTLSVAGDLADDAAPQTPWLRFDTRLGPWEAWKARLREATGITLGGSFGVLYQNYSDPLNGEANAAGYKFTLNGSKALLYEGTPEALTLDVAVEARGPIGTDLAPLQGGIAAGNMVPTAATWGDFDLGITQFYLRQSLAGNRFQYAIGKVFAPNFVNAFPMFDDNRQFLNQNFSTSPTMASSLRGFGAVALWFPTAGGLYVQGGIYTANSSDVGSTIETFFKDDEFFTHVDIGWSALARRGVPIHARGPMDMGNVHLTFWHKDEQENAAPMNRPSMHGIAFNANFPIGDNTMWFVRAGVSEGWVTRRAISGGIGVRPADAPSDLFGLAVGWTEPSLSVLREQTVIETFYRFQVTENFAVTPDLQLILDPSLNPSTDRQVVASLRARLTF